MIDEESFQKMLDANPKDSFTRLVFADWLEERGDPRAAGYRWLGENEKCPLGSATKRHWLDEDWIERCEHKSSEEFKNKALHACLPVMAEELIVLNLWVTFGNRQYAENAFAMAYPELTRRWPDRFALKEHV